MASFNRRTLIVPLIVVVEPAAAVIVNVSPVIPVLLMKIGVLMVDVVPERLMAVV